MLFHGDAVSCSTKTFLAVVSFPFFPLKNLSISLWRKWPKGPAYANPYSAISRSLLSWSLVTPEIFWATASLHPARTPEVMALVRSGWACSCLMYACPAMATTSDILDSILLSPLPLLRRRSSGGSQLEKRSVRLITTMMERN
uniref:Uncharacterized protein n=1 Tax=Arundo donax TaxID=35708 RepID=A0A0A8YE95_ARUDO